MQNSRDAARDLADLRNSMRTAMQTGSDAELCAVLQVAREEMPDALKTLQRALERIIEKESSEEEGPPAEDVAAKFVGSGKEKEKEKKGKETGLVGLLKRTKTMVSAQSGRGSVESGSGSGSDGWNRDTLDREFIECGIDALRRMSSGLDTASSLPSWTITR
jgi:abelson tyrosine-protein kinase 1